MTQQTNPPIGFEQDAVLSALMQDNECLPPAELDQKILAQAHYAKHRKMNWSVPVSIAATVLFGLTFLWHAGFRPDFPTTEMDYARIEATEIKTAPSVNAEAIVMEQSSLNAVASPAPLAKKKEIITPQRASNLIQPRQSSTLLKRSKKDVGLSSQADSPVGYIVQEKPLIQGQTEQHKEKRTSTNNIIHLKMTKTTTRLLYKSSFFSLQHHQRLCFQNESIGVLHTWRKQYWTKHFVKQYQWLFFLNQTTTSDKAQIWLQLSLQSNVNLNQFYLTLSRHCNDPA